MADNVVANAGSGGATFAADDISNIYYPRTKITIGADGVTDGDVSSANPLPVTGIITAVTALTNALPAGTNAIGKLAANSGVDIGDVDVTTLPAITIAGAQTLATVTTVGAVTAITNALPAGTNAIGKLSSNTGVTIGAVELVAAQTLATVTTVGTVSAITAVGTITPGTAATSLGKAEDGGHTSGDVGVMALTVRQNTAAATSGSDADYQPLITDTNGRLHVIEPSAAGAATSLTTIAALSKAEDAVHASADTGIMALAVQKNADAALQADGDYAPLQVDSSGYLKVNIKAGAGSGGTAIADDAAFTVGTTSLTPVGGVFSTDTVDAGDAGAFQMDASRRLVIAPGTAETTISATAGVRVFLFDNADAQITSLGGGTQYAEDAVHASGNTGTMALAVRHDTSTTGLGADGDYAALGLNSAGRLYTTSTVDAALPAGTNNIGDVDVLTVPTDPFGANADAASATGSISAKLRFIAATGIPITGTVTVGSHAVTVASGGVASGAIASGAVASGAFASGSIGSGAIASGAIASGALASGSIAAGAIAAGATSIADNEDAASADADRGVKVLYVRKAAPANTSGTDGDYEFPQMSGGYQWVHDNKGLSNLAFSVAFTTLTRPANTTAYTAADSISDNATAGSVTALTATIADVNDDPIFISEVLLHSTDTGLAGKKVRAYLYNSDPTASTGVVGGDNAAFSNKKAGYLGMVQGWMETGFSDGSVGRLVPTHNDGTNYPGAGGFIITKPTSGAKTLFIQYQAVEAFTPSANSTTLIGTARGWQGRAV